MNFRRDTSIEMYSLVGTVIYSKTTEELEKEGYLCPTKCYFINSRINDEDSGGDYHEEYEEFVVNNLYRNTMIQNICSSYSKSKKILVLTRRVKHAKLLQEIIPNSIVITGSTPSKQRKEDFKRFKKEDNLVLIGSSQIFSAGINVPDLDIIINATGHKSSIQSIQIIGRVKRNHGNKKYGYFIDFNDNSKYLYNSTKERKKILKEYGNEIKNIDSLERLDIE